MNTDAGLLEDRTCKMIRSILLTCKGGTTAEKLYSDYRDMVGEGIPYRKLGYDTLNNFLKSIPAYCKTTRNNKGEIIVTGVADDSTRHMQDFLLRSKSKKRIQPVKGPTRRPMQHSTHWNPPPQQPSQHTRGGRPPYIQRPFGRGGGHNTPYRGANRMNSNNRGVGRGRGNRFNNNVQRAPLREPKEAHGRASRGSGYNQGPKNYPSSKQVKSPPRGQQASRQNSRPQTNVTNFKGDLEKYFVQNNLGEVPYKVAVVGSKGKEKYMATVTVEGTQFKTYPQTFNSRVEAEEAVAKEVVQKMGILTGGDAGSCAETTDPVVYSSRVSELLGSRHNGVWSTQVEKEYQEKYEERLPSLWYQEAEALNKIRVDCPVLGFGRYIVFPVSMPQVKKEPSPELPSVGNQIQPPMLQYPVEELWDVYVTYLRSTTDVSVRLIGPEYSEKFDELSGSMDLHYYDKNAIPGVQRPEIGKLYAAYVSADWHRVKVVELRGIMCTCVFLDHGDQDTIPIEDLREIAPKFLELPAQAIYISLSGLEDYEYNDNILFRLNELLLGKSLVAKVDNRSELSNHHKPGVFPRMVLFDTSSEEVDVNINQKLIELLISEDYQSRLPQPGGEEIQVYLLYIATNGDLFVRKDSDSYATIEKLIEDNVEKISSNGPSGLIGMNQLYLARCPDDKKLYRAELMDPEKTNGKYKIFLVDIGKTTQVDPLDIYDLSNVCETLSDMPRIALKCSLEGVPPEGHTWSEEASAALRELVPDNQLVKLKVLGGPTDCPKVELNQTDSNQGSLNFDLSTEFDIFPALLTGRSTDSPLSPHKTVITSASSAEVPKSSRDPALESLSNMFNNLSGAKPLVSPILPAEGEHFDVKVTCAVSPSSFIVQPYNETEKLQALMAEMDNFYSTEENLVEMKVDYLIEGEYFAGRHSDGYWYRVRITKCIDTINVAVRLVDYGDLSMLNISDMQPLWKNFRQLPLQAINAKLANIKPVECDWRPEDTVWFSNRVADQEFVSVIKKISPSLGDDFDCVLHLVLIDTSHPSIDKFIDQELVEDKRATAIVPSDKGSE